MTKGIAVLGSTGSIGRQTLEVIESLGSAYQVVALAAGSNEKLLAEQVGRFRPALAVLDDRAAAVRLEALVHGVPGLQVAAGREGLLEAATFSGADLVVMAQVGFSGFEPLVAALKRGKRVALANKESLVIGGEILKRLGLLDGEMIIPVDSEHSAIRQCLGSSPGSEVARIILTASGGPFFGMDRGALGRVTPAQALAHPTWEMGPKITIDSATMMNKGLEVLEAKWLFGFDLEQIEVVVHRQSIVHSMVEFVDGSIMAQVGPPDMRLPIQYALTYPGRKRGSLPPFSLAGKVLSFENPDRKNFPCLDLAYRAGRAGGTMPAALNAANEVVVESFLEGKVGFNDIPALIEAVMNDHCPLREPDAADIVEADRRARILAAGAISRLAGRVT